MAKIKAPALWLLARWIRRFGDKSLAVRRSWVVSEESHVFCTAHAIFMHRSGDDGTPEHAWFARAKAIANSQE